MCGREGRAGLHVHTAIHNTHMHTHILGLFGLLGLPRSDGSDCLTILQEVCEIYSPNNPLNRPKEPAGRPRSAGSGRRTAA